MMIAQTRPSPLVGQHAEEMRASGLTDETIVQAGIRTVRDGQVRDILGWQPTAHAWGEGWAIDFPTDNGTPPYSRVKLDHPRFRDGKPIKYESPLKSPNRAYRPPGFVSLLAESAIVCLTEGEKKVHFAQSIGRP